VRKRTRGLNLLASRDRREDLWSKYLRTRWKKHRNLLVEAYLPLVRCVADQVAARLPKSVDSEDLISAGV
jgi:DNA-directed RNA polymerase specialized sigma subunit